MLDWAKIALLVLEIAKFFIDLAKQKQQMDAGRDKAIAESAAAILAKTQAANATMQEVTGLTSEQVDTMLKGLEP